MDIRTLHPADRAIIVAALKVAAETAPPLFRKRAAELAELIEKGE